MNLLDLMVKIGVDDQASPKIGGIASGITGKLGQAAKVVGTAIAGVTAAAGAGAVAFGKAAVDSYASYEQLAGGVAKLYGNAGMSLEEYAKSVGKTSDEVRDEWERNDNAQSEVLRHATEAFKTSGMSMNDYMEQATSFSAALINSLGGDTAKAAEQTDVAMRAMSDNVNTFGSDMQSVQYAFQGFAKQNYTMLDNLKLGYGGTKSEMERLISDANEYAASIGEASDLSIDSFSDIVTAIELVQEKQGIAGTTMREAMTTIEGSINSTRAAWDNLLTAIGSGDAGQIESAVSGIVDGIFGTWDEESEKRVGGIINNVAPVVQRVGNAVLNQIPSVAGQIGTKLMEALGSALGKDESWAQGIIDKMENIRKKFEDFFGGIAEGFSKAFDTDDGESALIHLRGILEDVWGFIDENILSNGEAIGEFLGTVASLLGTVADVVTTVLDVFGPLVPAIAGAVAALAAAGPIAGIFTAISGAVSFFATVIVPALGMVQSFGGAIALLTTLLGGPIPIIVALVGAIVGFVATNEDAREAILNAWNAVVDFFSGIPEWWSGVWTSIKDTVKAAVDDNLRKWDELKANASAKFEELKASAIAKFNEIKTNVINKVTELKTNATNRFNEVKTNISNAINGAKDTVTNAVANMYKAVKQKFDDAVNFMRGVPKRITDALGNVKDLLWNAGSSIINGLWDGMSNAFSDVTGWVSGIAGTIASLKGPLPYDRKVLIDNGMALMYGLQKGLERGFEQEVKPYVSGLGMEVSSSISAAPVAAAPVQKGVTVQVGELVVREEADVRKIAEQLYDISNRGTAWSTSYSVA